MSDRQVILPESGTPEFMALRDQMADRAISSWMGQNWTDAPFTDDEKVAMWAAVGFVIAHLPEIMKEEPRPLHHITKDFP